MGKQNLSLVKCIGLLQESQKTDLKSDFGKRKEEEEDGVKEFGSRWIERTLELREEGGGGGLRENILLLREGRESGYDFSLVL